MRTALFALTLLGCGRQADGTFIGNPELTARYIDNVQNIGLGGNLVATEVFVRGCGNGGPFDQPIDDLDFEFDGTTASTAVEIPEGDWCGVFMVMNQLSVRFERDGGDTEIVGIDFDLVVPIPFEARTGELFYLQLGDSDWIANLAALAEPGTTTLNSEADPALADAFFDGLSQDSTVIRAE